MRDKWQSCAVFYSSGVLRPARWSAVAPKCLFGTLSARVKLGRKWVVREDRILTDEETAGVFARLTGPNPMTCETCLWDRDTHHTMAMIESEDHS